MGGGSYSRIGIHTQRDLELLTSISWKKPTVCSLFPLDIITCEFFAIITAYSVLISPMHVTECRHREQLSVYWRIRGQEKRSGPPVWRIEEGVKSSWFQTSALLWMLYPFFWVIHHLLNFMCRRFGTLCSIFTGGVSRKKLPRRDSQRVAKF